MSRHKGRLPVLLAALAALLLLAAPVSGGGPTVHYRGTEVIEIVESDFSSFTPLPGGRLLLEGRVARKYFQCDPGEGPDLVSGWHVGYVSAILEPSGTLMAWGTSESLDLDYWPGEDPGGWRGTFEVRGPPGAVDYLSVSKSTGWGALEGSSSVHHEIWRDGGVEFFGHVKMP
ncbi:MAG: hypothetical protein R6X16_05120 [Anaerolineae bacterium]